MSGRVLRGGRGFTLVELLIAVLLSAIVIIALGTLITNATKVFDTTSQSGLALDRLHMALDVVRNDLRTAGYEMAPNAGLDDPRLYKGLRKPCSNPSWMGGEKFVAVKLLDGGATLALTGSDADAFPPSSYVSGKKPDRLELAGAFRTGQRFHPDTAAPGASSLTLFNPSMSNELAEYVFDGAILGVVNKQGGMQFLRAGIVTWGNPTGVVGLASGDTFLGEVGDFGSDSLCRFDFLDKSDVIVSLQRIAYDVVQDPVAATDFLLVREELDASGESLDPPRRVIIARNIVDFQVWFDGVAGATGLVPDMQNDGDRSGELWSDDEGTIPNEKMGGTSDVQVERARYAYLQISARHDAATKGLAADGSGEALKMTFPLYPNVPGSQERSYVSTVRGEVTLTNFAFADVR